MQEKDFIDNSMIKAELYTDVIQFNRDIIGTPVRDDCWILSDDRLDFAVRVLSEEIDEFLHAHGQEDIHEAIDAMIDLIYYAFGRLYEMGVTAKDFVLFWNKVHEANMRKVRGDKGRGTDQDAIKPEGWTQEKVDLFNKLTPEQINEMTKLPVNEVVDVMKRFQRGDISSKCGVKLTIADVPTPFQECAELRKKKGADYRGAEIQMKDYFPFGRKSYTQMVWTKVLRLRSLVADDRAPKNESVRDTLLDLLNYTCFFVEAIDKGEV